MPEETNSATSTPPDKEAEKPKARRVSSKPRRKADEKKEPKGDRQAESDVKQDRGTNAEDGAQSADDGKQPETKRPNRRRRGKGKPQGKDSEKEGSEDGTATEKGEPKEKPAPQGSSANAQRPPQTPRRKVDSEKLAKNAWKIYLAEVSEEGVALIGDNDARELARRCFRLSEIFLEEEDRRS